MGHTAVTVGGGQGPALWSYGAKQYAVFVDASANIIACQFNRATKALEASINLATVSGNPLSLPLDSGLTDPHETASVGVTPNGVIYVAGNNNDDLEHRVVKISSASAFGTAANWANAAGDFTYVASTHPVYYRWLHFAAHTLFIVRFRQTGATHVAGQRAFRHDGTSWADLGYISLGGTGDLGGEDAFYANHVYVEGPRDPHPNRAHMFGAWDRDVGSIHVDGFSYCYSDDVGTSWRNVAGTALTLPFDFDASPTTGTDFGDPAVDMLYASGVGVDAAGFPCGMFHKRTTPNQGEHIIRWNGSSWTDDTSVAFRFAGHQNVELLRFRGDLWTLGRPQNSGVNTLVELRQVASPNRRIHLAGPVASGWYPWFDPVALQESGTVETLHVNDDVPRICTAGNHARVVAA